MYYRAVGNRCALDLSSIPLDPCVSRRVLEQLGFEILKVDIVLCAQKCIGNSVYKRKASYRDAPEVLDCSSLVKWAWGLRGVWVPRLSIQQSLYGMEVSMDALEPGDAVFTSGFVDLFETDPLQGVGHVGLATGENTIVHAVGRKSGIREVSLDSFLKRRGFRGIRRFATPHAITVQVPQEYDIEWSDDLKWIVLSHSGKLSRR